VANKNVFSQAPSKALVPTNTTNAAGGKAYVLPAEAALAQLAATGTFNDTYYGKGTDQLDAIKKAADGVSPIFLAQTAVWAREKGCMKDMPAALVCMLSKADTGIFHKAFDRAIDNGKQLRTFVQMMRSGAFGRKCLGSSPKRAVRRWFESRSDASVFRASIGSNPSLAQILKLAHPKPKTDSRRALYGYLRGFTPAENGQALVEGEGDSRTYRYRASDLPSFVRELERFRKGETKTIPNVDYRFLEGVELPEEQKKALWTAIARRGRFIQTFKNLNNYLSRGIFDVSDAKAAVVAKLKDKDEIRKARVLPFQLLAAWLHTDAALPHEVREALQDAMEVATENVPAFADEVVVCLDVSDSMNGAPVTGRRKGATTKVMCNQAAALIASAILRQNRSARVIPFDTSVRSITLNPRDSVMTNTAKLTVRGGGTACRVALDYANQQGVKAGLVVYLSDNESWADSYSGGASGLMEAWLQFKRRNPKAKMVCLNLQSSATTQAVGDDVLNIGGFSDEIWKVVADFVAGRKASATEGESETPAGVDTWIAEIKAIDLDAPLRSFGEKASESLTEVEPDEDGDGEAS
jgi:60 kDa SS-A/Ro ribonucleoprotein